MNLLFDTFKNRQIDYLKVAQPENDYNNALSGWAVCASLGHPQVVPSQCLGTAQPPAWRKASQCPFQPRATDTNTQHPSPKVFSKALNPVHRLAPESPGTTQHPLFTPPRF